MADAATDPTADLEATYRQLLQQTLQPQPVPLPQGPSASSHEGRGWLSLLGEALGGGEQYGSTAEREAGGIAALGAMGRRMLEASDYSYRPHTLGSIIGQGMGAAGEALGQRQAVSAAQAAAAQDYQTKQQEMQLARIKEAVPLLTNLQSMQQLAQARRIALGGNAPGTSIGAVGGDLPNDKAAALKIIAQRESGGDPTALNYVAKADPTAYERGATASGKYQIVNSTWREGMQLAGIDPSKYATARDAPESVQDQVAGAIWDKYGNKPWQKGAKDWVKDEAGKYQLATVRPPASAPGGAPTTTPPAGSTASTAPPGVTMGDVAHPELAPGPPGSKGGAPIGIGAALGGGTTTLPVPPIPPPAVAGTPLPAGKLQSTGKPPGQAAADAILGGVQLAQATPLVRGTGQEAGPSSAVATLAQPPAQPGWGGAVGAYGDGATTTPPPAPTPQATSQAPPAPTPATTPTPPAVTAPPPGGMPEPAPYAYQRQPLPPDIQSRIAQPLSPEQLEPYNRAIQSATTVEAIQAAQDKRSAAIAAARAEVVKEGDAWQQNERNKQQEIWQKRWDAWQTGESQRQQAAQKLEADLRLKQAEGEQQRITNKEAVFNQANQKGLEAAQTEQLAARNSVAQLEGFRSVSDAVKQPNWLQTTKWPGSNHSIAEQLQQAGIPVEDTAGVQLLQGAMTNLTRTLREGMPMGALSDRDLDFIQRMGPTEWMDQDTRTAAVDYLQRAFRAKQRFASDVQKEMSRGKNYGDAVDTADAKQPKSFVPTVDSELSSHWTDNSKEWVDRRIKWAQDNDVRPGTLFHMNNGNIVIWKRKSSQGQQ
jgi:hypothetical protein